MGNFAVKSVGLGKRYSIGYQQTSYKTLRESVNDTFAGMCRRLRHGGIGARRKKPAIWALKDLTFDVQQGDVVGVIGRNGAGKSTLLKVLSRITEPTEGYADVRGRVGSLLEVGTGFHPELTGRENIYLNSAILGMSRGETDRKFDAIVDFAEVEKFIDTPVKRYSSGMYLRLAFSVAAHLEPEILLVDEVLAVGDLAFQRKCLSKMQEVGNSGQTVIFVSHDMTAISKLATKSMVLHDGRIDFWGETSEAIHTYASRQRIEGADLSTRQDRNGDGMIRVESMRFLNAVGDEVNTIGAGDAVSIVLGYKNTASNASVSDLALDLRLTDVMGHPVATVSTRYSPAEDTNLDGRGSLICDIPSLTLAEEIYGIDVWLAYRGGLADQIHRAGELRVITSDYFGTGHEPVKRKHGPALLQHSWRATNADDFDRSATHPQLQSLVD